MKSPAKDASNASQSEPALPFKCKLCNGSKTAKASKCGKPCYKGEATADTESEDDDGDEEDNDEEDEEDEGEDGEDGDEDVRAASKKKDPPKAKKKKKQKVDPTGVELDSVIESMTKFTKSLKNTELFDAVATHQNLLSGMIGIEVGTKAYATAEQKLAEARDRVMQLKSATTEKQARKAEILGKIAEHGIHELMNAYCADE